MALEKAGYKVVALGALTPADEFVNAAIETNADGIMVSSLYGQGELDCSGFRDLCVEAGIGDILIYLGGNLVVGKLRWEDAERRFLDMGFDQIGRAHDCTPVNHAHLVCRLLLDNKKPINRTTKI